MISSLDHFVRAEKRQKCTAQENAYCMRLFAARQRLLNESACREFEHFIVAYTVGIAATTLTSVTATGLRCEASSRIRRWEHNEKEDENNTRRSTFFSINSFTFLRNWHGEAVLRTKDIWFSQMERALPHCSDHASWHEFICEHVSLAKDNCQCRRNRCRQKTGDEQHTNEPTYGHEQKKLQKSVGEHAD